jgi:type I restriction enzyme S subunit
MAKMNDYSNHIPIARFSEFSDFGPWEVFKLKSLLEPVSREVVKPSSKYLGLGLRSHGKGTFLKDDVDPETNSMECLYEVAAGDLIVNITFAWEGAIAIAGEEDDKSLVSHRFPTYKINSKKVLPGFFRHVIRRPAFVYSLGLISPGGAGRNRVMSKKDFLELPVLIPKIPEQQRISDTLQALDDLIDSEIAKLKALKGHKEGLMQQIFPAAGEILPKLRFQEFENSGPWQLCPLKDLLCAHPDYGINASSIPYEEGQPIFLRITDISEDGQFIYSGKVSVDAHLTDSSFLRVGDIVLARTGASVGKSYTYRKEDGMMAHAGYLIRIRPNPEAIDFEYLAHYLNSPDFWSWVSEVSGRGAQPGLNSKQISELLVPLPPLGASDAPLAEQQKIAQALSSLTDTIQAQTETIDALQNHKLGLLQQLFPVLNEVQG